MQKSDLTDFTKIILTLAEVFAEPMSDPRMQAYFAALEDLTIEQVERAVNHLMRSAKFFPKPAEIRELIEGSIDDRAAAAWSRLVQAIEKGGPYASLHVDDLALADAILRTFGGWIEACNRLPVPGDPMYANLQKQFAAYYRAASRHGVDAPRYFAGLHEAGNRQNAGVWNREFPVLMQSVVIVSGERVFKRNLEFDGRTGALTESSRKMLEAGLAPLPPAPAPKMLPAPTQEMASPEEVAEIMQAIRQLAGRGM